MTNERNLLRELAEAVIKENDQCVGLEGPSWTLREKAEAALNALAAKPCGQSMGNLDTCDLPAGHAGDHSGLTNEGRARIYRPAVEPQVTSEEFWNREVGP